MPKMLKIKRVIILLESWCSKSNLIVNTDMNKAMLFQLNTLYDITESVITFKNMKITCTPQFRFLDINYK
jgi:hypothetical protein